jgi:hypothetical protein
MLLLLVLLVLLLLLLLVVVVKESDERREWRLKIARGEEQEEEQEEEDVFKLANITFLKNIHRRSHSPHFASLRAHIYIFEYTHESNHPSLSLSLSLGKKTCASLPPPPLLFLRWLRRLIHRQRALGAEDITRRRRYPKQRDG